MLLRKKRIIFFFISFNKSMSHIKEYSKPTVGQIGCTYSRLSTISQGQMAGMSGMTVPGQNEYVVPKYCTSGSGPNYPPRYDTLSHGQDANCGGYFKFQGAYPFADCKSCQTSFTKRPCTHDLNC